MLSSSHLIFPLQNYALIACMGLVGSQLCLFFPFAVLVAITWSYVIADEGGWGEAHATFYGGSDASGTNNGACGYGNQISSYGVATTALSTPLFNGGDICGACFAIKCFNDVGCLPGEPLLVVTATNLCPPGSNGGWCDHPKHHFDLSQPAFSQIARLGYGHVPLAYKRVPCKRWGGIQFNINGHTFFNLVLITNVGGAGDIRAVAIKGEGGEWMQMNRNWGQNWQIGGDLGARMLSFQLTSSDGRTLTCYNVAPSNWQFGKTYVGGQF